MAGGVVSPCSLASLAARCLDSKRERPQGEREVEAVLPFMPQSQMSLLHFYLWELARLAKFMGRGIRLHPFEDRSKTWGTNVLTTRVDKHRKGSCFQILTHFLLPWPLLFNSWSFLGEKQMCIVFLIFIAHWILCTKSSEPSLMYIQALKMHPTCSNPYHASQGLFKQTLPGFSASTFTFLFTDGFLSSTCDLVPFMT